MFIVCMYYEKEMIMYEICIVEYIQDVHEDIF